MRVAAAVLALALAPAGAAGAQDTSDPAAVADRLAAGVVVVDEALRDELPEAAAGRLRLRIVERAIGRIRIALVAPAVADAAGGVGGFANAVDRARPVRGALLVGDGRGFHVVTSYDRPVVDALRPVLEPGVPQPLEERLLRAVDVLGVLDPGPAADLQAGEPSDGVSIGVPDDVWSTLRVVLLVVGLSVALPFVLVALLLTARVARRRRATALDRDATRAEARRRLLAVADAVTELESDPPDPAYATLLDRYAEAEALIDVSEPDERSLHRAATLLDEAERAAQALRSRREAEQAFGGQP